MGDNVHLIHIFGIINVAVEIDAVGISVIGQPPLLIVYKEFQRQNGDTMYNLALILLVFLVGTQFRLKHLISLHCVKIVVQNFSFFKTIVN